MPAEPLHRAKSRVAYSRRSTSAHVSQHWHGLPGRRLRHKWTLGFSSESHTIFHPDADVDLCAQVGRCRRGSRLETFDKVTRRDSGKRVYLWKKAERPQTESK